MNTPTITFNTQAEVDQWEDTLLQNIKNSCKDIFVNDNFEYNFAKDMGLTMRQMNTVFLVIECELKDRFPDHGAWCNHIGGDVRDSLDGLNSTLIESNLWDNIYASRSKEQIFDLFIGHAFRKLLNYLLRWNVMEVIDNTEDIEILI